MKFLGEKVYLAIMAAVVVFLAWRVVETKVLVSTPEYQGLTLLQPRDVPVWEASDSASVAESRERVAGELTANAYLVMDLSSRTVLLEGNADVPLPPASTTKLVTALTALELYDLNEVVVVSTAAAQENDGGGLFPDEQITVRDLLVGLLVSSANDSAYALAEHAPGGESEFLQRMNELGQKLHLQHAMFQNPAGYDDPANTMSARDLAIVTLEATEQSQLLEWMGLEQAVVYNAPRTIRHFLFTTNDLLGIEPRLIAGKTGTTELAGQVLVSIFNQAGRTLLVVIMGSQDRYADTQLLLQWVSDNIRWQLPGDEEILLQ